MIPVVTLIGIDFGTMIGAAVLTETVFSWPGLGSKIADAVDDRDLARPARADAGGRDRLRACINLVVDLSYAWFDPRIRLADSGLTLTTRHVRGARHHGDDRVRTRACARRRHGSTGRRRDH